MPRKSRAAPDGIPSGDLLRLAWTRGAAAHRAAL